MQLTKFSDYSLRVLLYLAVHTDRAVPASEISRAYGVSPHLVVKVAQRLIANSLVTTTRGRRGGLRLAKAPEAINVGVLVRRTEPNWHLVECFDRKDNRCPIVPACGLKNALEEARRAFLLVLDHRTLADLIPRAPALKQLLHLSLERSAAS